MKLRRIRGCFLWFASRARTKRSVAYRVPTPAPGVWPAPSIFLSR